MQDYPSPKTHPVFYNVRPLRYTTWLDLYDSIPENLRKEPTIRFYEELTHEQYRELYNEELSPMLMGQANYQLQTEFILARVAEELLPARLKRSDINLIEGAMHKATRFDSSADFYQVVEVITPLWAVASKE